LSRQKAKQQPGFEEALGRLEEVVRKLEAGDLPLEEALTLYEEGVRLTRLCSAKLEEAKGRLEVLSREGGTLKVKPLEQAPGGEKDMPTEEA
jgi:exodeoxyribonuclease VII small subunit